MNKSLSTGLPKNALFLTVLDIVNIVFNIAVKIIMASKYS